MNNVSGTDLGRIAVWLEDLCEKHGLSIQLSAIWLQQRGFTAPRDLTPSETVGLIKWARI